MSNDLIINSSRYPYSVGWAITNKCNLMCKHCNMNSGNALNNELTKKECFKIIDDLADNYVQRICFLGGEPLVRKDFFEITNYAIKKGIFVNVTTNGLLINDYMIENELFKFDLVRVSLDGPNAEIHEFIRNLKGSYDITLNNIKKMVDCGINVGVVTCISHKNLNYIDEMVELLDRLKVKNWFIPILSASGRGKNLKEEILSSNEIERIIIEA